MDPRCQIVNFYYNSRITPTLLVFLKAPVPGRVKTRLGAKIGARKAAAAYRRMVRAVLADIRRLEGTRVIWVYDPAPDFPDLNWLGLRRAQIWRQTQGGLGKRLSHAFRRAFREGQKPVCAIGADSPGLGVRRLRAAFLALKTSDAALGPSEDGGYYLIGMSRYLPALLRGIPWSTPMVLKETLRRARAAGLRIQILSRYFDVDTLGDYRRWLRRAAGNGDTRDSLSKSLLK